MCRRKDVRSKRCPCDDPVPRRQRQNLAYAVATKGERDEREIERRERKVVTVKDMVADLPQAEAVTQTIASSPEVAREMASRLRAARENAESTEAWLLNGRENTPGNIAAGVKERQEEILAMGSVLAERAQAIHGIDVEEEKRKQAVRLAEAEAETQRRSEAYNEVAAESLRVKNELAKKYGVSSHWGLPGTMSDEDEAIYDQAHDNEEIAKTYYAEKRTLVAQMLKGEDEESLAVADSIAAANRQVISEIRPVGAKVPDWDSELSERFMGNIGDTIQKTFPDDWIKSSDEKGQLFLERDSAGRAHYHPGEGSTYIATIAEEPPAADSRFYGWKEDTDANGKGTGVWRGPLREWKSSVKKPRGDGWVRGKASAGHDTMDGWVRDDPQDAARIKNGKAIITVETNISDRQRQQTMQHEFAHRIQHSRPHISVMEKAYIASRTTNENGIREPLKAYIGADMTSDNVSYNSEVVREDNWINPYMGKEYRDSEATELLSMGTESVFGGNLGGLVGFGHAKKDPETRNWILGAFATL